jgi:tetratricopeptide (TPR) repeat protein
VIFLFARQLHLAGDLEAISQYQRALTLDPACEKAHLYIAQLLASGSDCNLRDAAEHARNALRLRPTNSMVPESEFVETYQMAVGTEASVSDGICDDSWIAGQAIGELLLLHPRVTSVLEEADITCSECAGYSNATLAVAASEVGASLTSLVYKIRMLLSGTNMEDVR